MSENEGDKHVPFKATTSTHIIAGGTAGLVETCLLHPLDVIKTRFQVQSQLHDSGSRFQYTSMFDCVARMCRNEGALSLYKGILPPALNSAPKCALKFFVFDEWKTLFTGIRGMPHWLALSLAGLGCGLLEGFLINPFEVVKVRQQVVKDKFSELPSTWSTARDIALKEGLGSRGLSSGLTATMLRNGSWHMVYFGLYCSVTASIPPSHGQRDFIVRLSLAFCAGVAGSVLSSPFDVVKSRIQAAQPQPGHVKYRSCLQTLVTLYREEGFLALYKGFVPKLLRIGPGSAIMMLVYEHVSRQLAVGL